jgi:Ankyrin repeat
LLKRGAKVKAVGNDGWTALHLACRNGAFGKEIIPLLIKAGVDVGAKNNQGGDGLSHALGTGYSMAETLLPFLPPNSKPSESFLSESDPIGNMVMKVKLGNEIVGDPFASGGKRTSMWLWAQLRNGKKLVLDNSPKDAFNVLIQQDNIMFWIWLSREPSFQQHPITGNTVLHLLCRTDKLKPDQKLEVLFSLKKDFRNPLIPNAKGERAIELTTDPALKAELTKYMEFRPIRGVMQWYGPAFGIRVRTMLLVMQRLGVGANKDVKGLLAQYLSKVEHIYVVAKK